jgi:hypothetical protein
MQGVSEASHPHFTRGSLASARRADIPAAAAGLALLRPVYWIAAVLAAGAAFHYVGIEAATLTFAVLIGLWAFAEPETSLWMATAFMIYVFVFFQREAPLGDELPEEFFFWGTGLALITAGLAAATLFASRVDWPLVRKRALTPASLAMLGTLLAILAASVYGLFVGNQPFAVARQLFGCVLLPVYYFISLALFRSAGDAERWLRRVSWCVTLGSLWYAAKLLSTSAARGYYYREQSALVTYAGAVAAVALCGFAERRWKTKIRAAFQSVVCVLAILSMGGRGALAGLVAAAALLFVLAAYRRGWEAMILAVSLAAALAAGGVYVGNRMILQSGLSGDIARRFFISVSDDRSYQGRMAQMDYVVAEFKLHPVLGAGMGSVTVFFAPGLQGRIRVTSVDNGWGYVMFKMGSLGLAAFSLMMAFLLRESVRRLASAAPGRLRSASLAFFALFFSSLVIFWAGPLFFHFTSVAFFGPALAGIMVLAEARSLAVSAPVAADPPGAVPI